MSDLQSLDVDSFLNCNSLKDIYYCGRINVKTDFFNENVTVHLSGDSPVNSFGICNVLKDGNTVCKMPQPTSVPEPTSSGNKKRRIVLITLISISSLLLISIVVFSVILCRNKRKFRETLTESLLSVSKEP